MSSKPAQDVATPRHDIDCVQLKSTGFCDKGTMCMFNHRSTFYRKNICQDNVTTAINRISAKLDTLTESAVRQSHTMGIECVAITTLTKQIRALEQSVLALSLIVQPESSASVNSSK